MAQKWPFKAQLTPAVMDILGFKSLYLKSSPHAAGLHVWYGPMQLHILWSSVSVFLMMMEASGNIFVREDFRLHVSPFSFVFFVDMG